MAKVCVFTADGFEEIEGLTVVDLLRRAGAEVQMVSISNTKTVTGSHNIVLQADVLFEEADYSKMDLLVLPGGMPGTLHLGEHTGLCRLLQDFAAEGKKVAAICAAPSVLGALGILKEKKAVCYPGPETKLTGAQTGTQEVAREMDTQQRSRDGNITTSRGLGTAIPFALELISQLYRKKKPRKSKIYYFQRKFIKIS